MILINLFITFFKIGILNFGGGNGITTIINKEIIANKEWITKEDFINIITISRITPGPVATNIATYVGAKVAGITGAIIATIGLITAPILIITLITLILHKINFLNYYLENLKPVIIALWIMTIVILFESIFLKVSHNNIEILKSFTLAGLNLIILLLYKNITPAILIISSGIIYIII
ncbi:chromate transporter [Borrelia hermsii]|uniref:Chromate transport protein ChrA n=2 Tax=Borrelia hermsii TaxID=140 RepID=A0AAN0X6L6_BORHE|nr:chromate transporter [Borrelia hermsii]ANA43258.1 chromate transporter [Borrelia hermsii HS1]UPA08166.1 chromate transporter [Borrelia hermsii DAH]AJW73253.1 chromate transporter [Borrelia hermsii CC1]AMR75824.1 Chromate transport protein ChrA [Borrelia hermsii]UEQ07092.1 chromate transporter [Borrelia hermsii]